MGHPTIAAACVLLLTGCASADPQEPGPTAGSTTVSILGTPLFLAFKGAVCVASLAIAAPVAAVASLSADRQARRDTVDGLGDGVSANCGPPYVVDP